jgi:hypothetical protein
LSNLDSAISSYVTTILNLGATVGNDSGLQHYNDAGVVPTEQQGLLYLVCTLDPSFLLSSPATPPPPRPQAPSTAASSSLLRGTSSSSAVAIAVVE